MQEYRLLRKKTKTRKQLLTMWEVPVKEELRARPGPGAEIRGSKPACAGLDGLKNRSLWLRHVHEQR
jgi:hypothetical protein